MRQSRLILGIALSAAMLPGNLAAQDASKLRIAGLSLGAVEPSLADTLVRHGFFPQRVLKQPQEAKRDSNRAYRIISFERGDGHALRVGVQREGDPVVRSLQYEMDKDIDSYELIRKHLLGLFAQPTAIHGTEDSVRIAIWEIPGTDMNAEGLLTTAITLIRDPVEGHSLAVREFRIRPDFTRGGTRQSGRVIATE